ncbi:MAG: acyl-CoA dehydrogenase family protein [Parvibaculales bacterium]
MKLGFTDKEEEFRDEVVTWLEENLQGEFASLRGETSMSNQLEKRLEWEKHLGKSGWSAIGYPKEFGGRAASLAEQVIFAEEYARAGAPGRIGHIGVELAGPTILHFGSDKQKQQFLPDIVAGNVIWAQGYSEPNAGSDLSNIQTKATLVDGEWVIEGQKIWTSMAHFANWIFVLARTEPGSKGSKGLSFLLVPIDQEGITIRPIKQITGDAEFNETFFDGARTAEENVVGGVGNGWAVAMGLLAFERGVGTLGQLMSFIAEFSMIVEQAKQNGKMNDPLIRQRIGEAYTGLKVMRHSALRMLSDDDNSQLQPAAMTYKLYWSAWHKNLTQLGMDVIGLTGEMTDAGDYLFEGIPQMYLQARADSIYGGTNQIQRNIVSEHAMGLPREPKVQNT